MARCTGKDFDVQLAVNQKNGRIPAVPQFSPVPQAEIEAEGMMAADVRASLNAYFDAMNCSGGSRRHISPLPKPARSSDPEYQRNFFRTAGRIMLMNGCNG